MAPVLYIACKGISINITIPSLVDICIVKLVTTTCRQADIKASLQALLLSVEYFRTLEDKWRNVEDIVQRKVAELVIPSELKCKLSYFIKPICQQIVEWTKYRSSHVLNRENFGRDLSESQNILKQIEWTIYGTINKKKTAEAMVSDASIDIMFRFHLACKYCIEDSIGELWDEMITFEHTDHILNLYEYSHLLKFWSDILKNVLSFSSASSFCDVLIEAVKDGNKPAIEFFLPLVTNIYPSCINKLLKELYILIMRSQSYFFAQYQIELFILLFSQVDEFEQAVLLEVYSDGLLYCLLIGPYQDSFMQTLAHLFDVLSNDGAKNVMECLVQNIKWNKKDYDYSKLFKKFWQQCPIGKKKYIMEYCSKNSLLFYDLYSSGEKETLQLILVDVDWCEQLNIISYYENRNLYFHGWSEFISYLKALALETQNERHHVEKTKNVDKSDEPT